MSTTTKTRTTTNEAAAEIISGLKWDTFRAIREGLYQNGKYAKFKRGSFGAEIVDYMGKLSQAERRNLYSNSIRKIRRSSKAYSLLSRHKLNLRDSKTVLAQLKPKLDLPPISNRSGALTAKPKEVDYKDYHVNVNWKLVSVFCKDETDGAFGTEWGEDEIHMGGFGLKTNGGIQKWEKKNMKLNKPYGKFEQIDSFKVGDFSDTLSPSNPKRTKVYEPPLQLCEFKIGENNQFPLKYAISCTLMESDSDGAIDGFFKKLTEKALKEVRDLLIDEDDEQGFIATLVDDVLEWFADLFFGDDAFKPLIFKYEVKDAQVLNNIITLLKGFQVQWSNKLISQEVYQNYITLLQNALSKTETTVVKAHGGTYEIKYKWAVNFPLG